MPNLQEILLMLAACLVCAVLGAVGGYVARGDCVVQAKATAVASKAQAETKAADINTKFEVKRATRAVEFDDIERQVAALPPHAPKRDCGVLPVAVQPPHPAAPSRTPADPAASPDQPPPPRAADSADGDDRLLDADELRLWNAGNAGGHRAVQ